MEKDPSVLDVKELVSYQEGAIVSKTLLDKKSGTLTLFAFDKGQGLSEHTSPYNAFLYVLEGETEVTINGKPHQLHHGQAIVLPANQPHAVKATTRFKMLLVMIHG